ncbi:hypothetical protein AXE80_10720 [Wenyingzhuangia fucanilytica]|uniref:Uncharacterized protein n=1 Tax=Wenyingzhuangia fucanilytica TaxID=1790137 RepID=A0A1B1Y7H6_9FLAO|nr:hypothetical protein [Wenyingzhuangia fucanilytica]ANW96716.1 hypothetical protein AXE80_10720 [Wenyingzhuangia fucanilytica]
MISKEEEIELKKVFGRNYSPYIQNSFEKNGVKNQDGSSVSKTTIRMVMTGNLHHPYFAKAIFKAAEEKKAEDAQYESMKSQVLGIKKAVAVTTA